MNTEENTSVVGLVCTAKRVSQDMFVVLKIKVQMNEWVDFAEFIKQGSLRNDT